MKSPRLKRMATGPRMHLFYSYDASTSAGGCDVLNAKGISLQWWVCGLMIWELLADIDGLHNIEQKSCIYVIHMKRKGV
jgi:hypothetical protein